MESYFFYIVNVFVFVLQDILQGYQVPSLDVSGYLPDTDMLKSENNSLKSKLRQMMEELQSEQGDWSFKYPRVVNSTHVDHSFDLNTLIWNASPV